MRSPSQWPGTARSAASAGRWLIRISGAMQDLPRPRLRARGTRNARPVRRQAVSSRRSAPRPCTYSAWSMASWLMRPRRAMEEPQAASDLFWAPGRGPPPVLPTPAPAALPWHDGAADCRPVRGDDQTGEPVLHVPPQRLVDRQLGWLGTAGGSVGVPLRGRGPVRQTAAARGGVAAQLAGDRGRRALKPASDLAHPVPLRAPDRDLLSLCKRQRAP